MQIFFNDPKLSYLASQEKIDSAIASVLSGGQYLMGEETKLFEKAFAAYCNSKHCVTVANGTDALELALRAAECNNSQVITVANAGCYTTTACNLVGATPVYVDIDKHTLSVDFDCIINAITPETKCIVVTHLFGMAVDVALLATRLKAAGKSHIFIIEDCAQAHGAKINGKIVGSMGDIATFSFYPTKNLGALGDGGCIVTNSDIFAQKVRRLKQYGWDSKYHSVIESGRNSRLDEIQSAILRIKLKSLNTNNTHRRSIIENYQSALGDSMRLISRNDESFVGHLCVAECNDRQSIQKALYKAGIPTDIHYPILDCDQEMMKENPMVCHPIPQSRKLVTRILSLPCYPEMSDNEVDYISTVLSKISKK